jgi:hypothetical protein
MQIKHRAIERALLLSTEQIESISEKGVDVQNFLKWRLLINIQAKRLSRKLRLVK